jgi:hypothetical protein
VTDDSGAIRAEIAETRRDLTRALDVHWGRLLGRREPAITEWETTVAKSTGKAAGGAAKKKSTTVKKAVGTAKKAIGGAKKTLKAGKATKTKAKVGGKKSASGKATKTKAKTGLKAAAKTKKSASRKTTPKKAKPVVGKVVRKAEELVGHVPAAPAAGGVASATQGGAGPAAQVANQTEQQVPQQGPGTMP